MDLDTGRIADIPESYAGWVRLSRASLDAPPLDEQETEKALAADVPDELFLYDPETIVGDQARRGTCATFAPSSAAELQWGVDLSEQYLYNRAWHRYAGDPSDEATSVQAVLDSLRIEGACREDKWPYEPTPLPGNFPQDKVPPEAASAPKHRIGGWAALSLPGQDRGLFLAKKVGQTRQPIVITVPVFFANLCGWDDGLLIVPPSTGTVPSGYHAVAIVGYSLTDRYLFIQNSWSSRWGYWGRAPMMFDYVDKYLMEAFSLWGHEHD